MSNRQKIENVFEDFKADLAKMISIPSVLDEDDKDYLFGKNVQAALDEILEIAYRMGFKTYRDPEGYYGYAEIGEGEKLFGVLGHIDVVPAGDPKDWIADPFTLYEQDGFLYGRGTSDDKGPVVGGMYALKLLLDEGFELKQRVRFIYGTDEENLWRCMNKYVEKEEIPSMGFTPDSTFPLIYAEKGLIQFKVKNNQVLDFELTGGSALNAVPALAHLSKTSDGIVERLKAADRKFEVKDGQIEVIGKAVHAKDADKGENAIVYLASALVDDYSDNNMIRFLSEKATDPNGKLIFGEVEDEVSGKLMMNVGTAKMGETEQEIGIDFRFPVTYPVDSIREKVAEVVAEYGMEVKEFDYLRSIYVEKDSFLIQSLMHAYQSVTGDMESEPITSGGATYARAFENLVAFGAKMPDAISTEHQVNERVSIEDMKTAIEIYMEAFKELLK